MQKQGEDNWLPLESNPEVMNKFIKQLGFNTSKYVVQDLLSIEEWAQQMIGKPVLGIVFLYEINQVQNVFAKEEQQNLQNNKVSPNVFYMKQYAKNACGTIALFHTIMNNIELYPDCVTQGSYLSQFKEDCKGKTPQEIGESFKKNPNIHAQHKKSVKEGQTKVEEKVETHFISFIQKDGFIYELDGRKKAPVNHGECDPQAFVMMACLVIQQFMARDPDNNKFTLLAIAGKPQF